MSDDRSLSTKPIPDLERRKFYDDGEVTYIRVVPLESEITNVTNEQLILNTLGKLLEQAKLTNLYLEQIVGDNLGDNCG